MSEPTTRLAAGTVAQVLAVIAAMAVLVGVTLLPAALAARAAVTSVDREILDVPPLPEDLEPLAQTSYVTAADGIRIAELHGAIDRVPVAFEDIAEIARQAVIATEDADFYAHEGVDHRAIIRAAVTNVKAGQVEEGASTITQQYVRNVLLSTDQTLERKLNEALWAVQLEERLTKDEILGNYLNTAYFGNGAYGIGTAADFYFTKPASELVAHEAALLAGLIRAPETNDPVDRPEAATARRDIVLRQMAAAGFLTDEEAEQAIAQPLGLALSPDPPPVEPFLVDWVKRVAFDPNVTLQPAVQEALGADPSERQRTVFEGGITIVTSLDARLDAVADATVAEYLTDPVTDPLGGLITVEPGNGAIRAMALGPKAFGVCPPEQPICDKTKVNPMVPNAGARFGRQPGSSFKPFVALAALEANYHPYDWEVTTESGEVIDGCGWNEPYQPENYSERDQGITSIYEGIEGSINVWAVKLAKAVGVEQVKDVAERLGIRTSPNLFDMGPRDCSIALGTANVFPLEMATAYATIANEGVRCEPYIIERIEDRNGDVIYQHEPQCEAVVDVEVAHRLTDILRGPPERGTAPYVGASLARPVAGKTGTTQSFVDAWFLGFVPQYATAAWVGYELPTCPEGQTEGCGSMTSTTAGGRYWGRVTGGSIPAQMWADYMSEVLENVPVEDFPAPPPIPGDALTKRVYRPPPPPPAPPPAPPGGGNGDGGGGNGDGDGGGGNGDGGGGDGDGGGGDD